MLIYYLYVYMSLFITFLPYTARAYAVNYISTHFLLSLMESDKTTKQKISVSLDQRVITAIHKIQSEAITTANKSVSLSEVLNALALDSLEKGFDSVRFLAPTKQHVKKGSKPKKTRKGRS